MTAQLPAHDLGAEAAVLSAVLCEPDRLGELEGLTPEAFYDPRHQHVWRAILAVAEAGGPVDVVTVAGWLKTRERLLDAGGVPYLGKVVDEVASVHNVAAYGALVVGHWRRRRAVAELEGLAARLRTGAVGLEALVGAVGALEGMSAGKTSEVRTAGEIFAPLPRIPWLCRGLAIGPGRPTILSGYGGIGKTFAAQALALTIAAGRQLLWDVFEVQHAGGSVLHLDFEQGQWITDWRYQRLARSMGLGVEQLEGRLSVIHYPDFYLTSPDAERRLVKLCTGRAVCLIDSLRAACPGVDENDSKMGSYLYLLARVSELTGCVFLVIHHEGKSGGENPRQGIERLRGSSAIAAGAGSVISFVKDGENIRIEHTRANLGAAAEAVVVRLRDEGAIDPETGKSEGLAFEHMPPEQVAQRVDAVADAERDGELRLLCDRVLGCIERNPGIAGASTVARKLKIRDRQALDALVMLRESGAIENRGGKGKGARWHAVTQAPSEADLDPSEAAE
jgi:hypothetical protein